MNEMTFKLNEDKKIMDKTIHELLDLINNIFSVTSTNNLKELNEISNEFILFNILRSEPNIESMCGKIELANDNSFGIRYGNMMAIIKCFNNYLEQNIEKMQNPNSFKDVFIVNDIISKEPDTEQIIKICEFLMLMTAISTQKEYFLDKLSTLDESIQESYFNHIDGYIKAEDSERESSRISDSNNFEFQNRESSELHRRDTEKTFNKMIEQYERDHRKLNKAKDKEIEILNQKIGQLERAVSELDMKYKDTSRELEIAKSNEIHTSSISFQESLKNNELKATIQQQRNEIEDLKKNNKVLINDYLEENQKLKEKLEIADDKFLDIQSLQSENDKYKLKMKEFQKMKEKISDYENLIMIIESKSKNIENLQNDKKTLLFTLEKIQKELNSEKDKSRSIEFEKKKLEIDFQEAKATIVRLENRLENHQKRKESMKSFQQQDLSVPVKLSDNILITESVKLNENIIGTERINALDEIEKNDNNQDEFNQILIRELNDELHKIRLENKTYVKEIENLKANINPNSSKDFEKLNQEILSKNNELAELKKKLEDHSQMSKREYELISSSIYELALQFISVKNEVSRKLNQTNTSKTWLENERAKIFPYEK